MLSHQSGIPTWEFDPQWIRNARGADMDPHRTWTSLETLTYVCNNNDTTSTTKPGEQYSYSNTNYTILGHVIECVTGHEIVYELRTRLWEPCAMKSARLDSFDNINNTLFPPRLYHYVTDAFRRDAGVPAAYFDPVKDGKATHLMETTRATNLSCEWAAGGVCMNMMDLHTLGVALNDKKLLKDKSVMFTYQAPQSDCMDYNGAGCAGKASSITSLQATGEEYCLGICHRVKDDDDLWHHGGLTLSYSSRLMLLSNVVVACATNVGVMHSGFPEGESPWEVFVDTVLLPAVKDYVAS